MTLENNLIVSFRLDKVTLYDLGRKTVTHGHLTRSLDNGVMLCVISRRKALCMGGNGPSALVFSLYFSGFRLLPEQPMASPRSCPGVIHYQGQVYVFGGNPPSLRSCEKLSLDSGPWTPLPDLHFPKQSFTPCRHHLSIYLPEVRQPTKSFEVFDIPSSSFSILHIQMPFKDAASTSFLIGEEVTVLTTQGEVGKWRLNSEKFEVESLLQGPEIKVFCTSQTVVQGNKVYFAPYFSALLGVFFHLESAFSITNKIP